MKFETQPEMAQPKIELCSYRLLGIVSTLKDSDDFNEAKAFINLIDAAPADLIKQFLDVPELEEVWLNLLQKHSQIWLGWKLNKLPSFSIFNQLLGFYRYGLALLDSELKESEKIETLKQAMNLGSINAMLALGDVYIDKLQKEKPVDLSHLLEKVQVFAHLFLTPGYIMAGELCLAAWASAVRINQYFLDAIYYLTLAKGSLDHSDDYIHNAYGNDFVSASKEGKIFRGQQYIGADISQFIDSQLKIYRTAGDGKLDCHAKVQEAYKKFSTIKIPENKNPSLPTINLSDFFRSKIRQNLDSPAIAFLLSPEASLVRK